MELTTFVYFILSLVGIYYITATTLRIKEYRNRKKVEEELYFKIGQLEQQILFIQVDMIEANLDQEENHAT